MYNFFKYLRLYNKCKKIWLGACQDEHLLEVLNMETGLNFKLDWIGRAYAVTNPTTWKIDDVTGVSTQIFEFTVDGQVSDTAAVEHFIYNKIANINRYIEMHELFELITYKIKRLDDYNNFLIIFQPAPMEKLKKWTKIFVGELLAVIAAIITLSIIF